MAHIYLIAGEASGDARGAELMRALKNRIPDIRFSGAGGREMQSLAGTHFEDWADEAVVGLWDVLKKYGYFRKQFDRMRAEVAQCNPDAVLFIDYPGFNLRLAKALRKDNPKLRLFYYVSPQVWAWNRGRIPKMAQFLDLMLCIFPFEKELYEKSGLRTIFVGHPMLDSLAAKKSGAPREPDLVALLPGSREKEVRKIFPVMIAAAKMLRDTQPHVRFATAAASPPLQTLMLAQVREAGCAEDFCAIGLRNSHELMQTAGAGLVASGTATLEAAFFGLPFALLYRVAWLTWVVGKRLVRVPFLGMPNILAGREIVKEFLQDDAQPPPIAKHLERLITDDAFRSTLQADLAAVIASLGQGGAAARAADALMVELAREGKHQSV
jgi:lipid-A-disaccharide synthase